MRRFIFIIKERKTTGRNLSVSSFNNWPRPVCFYGGDIFTSLGALAALHNPRWESGLLARMVVWSLVIRWSSQYPTDHRLGKSNYAHFGLKELWNRISAARVERITKIAGCRWPAYNGTQIVTDFHPISLLPTNNHRDFAQYLFHYFIHFDVWTFCIYYHYFQCSDFHVDYNDCEWFI